MADTRYRLPESLGGGEWTEVERDPALTLMGERALVLRQGEAFVVVQAKEATKVEPPLPPEPPNGVYLLGGEVYKRVAADSWWGFSDEVETPWARICHLGTPIPLVPLKPSEPVTLPWRGNDQVDYDTVEVRERDHDEHVPVSILGIKTIYLARDDARSMAAALVAAADKAESGQP